MTSLRNPMQIFGSFLYRKTPGRLAGGFALNRV